MKFLIVNKVGNILRKIFGFSGTQEIPLEFLRALLNREKFLIFLVKLRIGILIIGVLLISGCIPIAEEKIPEKVEEIVIPTLLEETRAVPSLNITIVYDNNEYNKELKTAWGFSCLIEGLEKTILFDTGGDSLLLLSNMEKLGIDPSALDIIVISHLHIDHVGGLSGFLEKNSNVTVYLPKSLPENIKDNVRKSPAKLVVVSDQMKICENAYSTGELGELLREQSLVINTEKGLVVITGCAHPGIVNIIRKAKLMLNKKVYLALGGFHLCWLNPWQIKGIISGVRKEGVIMVAPCHCSGDSARNLFKKEYGKNFILVGVGKKLKV